MPPQTPDPFQQWLVEHLMELSRQIESINVNQKATAKLLLGNGQPGRIQIIEAEQRDFKEALDKVHNKISYFSGASIVIAFLLGTIRDWLFKH